MDRPAVSCKILAHRGDTEAGPDNSIPAIRGLARLDVDGLEFDVRVTADGVALATHDPTIGGLTFEAITLEQVRRLQGPDVDEFSRIATLAEVGELLDDGLTVNLELKSEGIGPELVQSIRTMDSRFDLLVSSFDARPLVSIKREVEGVRTGLITSVPIADPLAPLEAAGADALSAHWHLVDEALVDELRRRGFPLYVWTVNDPEAMTRMAGLGAAAIISDRPRLALDVLGR